MPRVVIAAGGTAGHVVPALAVADALRAEEAEVSFIGTPDRLESELVPQAGFEIDFLRLTGIDRGHPLRAARAAGLAAAAVGRARRVLRRRDADVVLGSGGYVAGPAGLAAASLRIPLVLAEADSHLGLANRLLARRARRVCLAFPIDGREGDRYLITGRPVPRAVVEADRTRARARFGLDEDAACVLVFGGSLGARTINLAAAEAWGADTEDFHVLHVSGTRDHADVRAMIGDPPPPRYTLLEYEPSLADPLAACDVVVARAGGSVFELAAAGRPAVLVPYPHATAGHQTANAGWMERAGAAVVIPDGGLDATVLDKTVRELLADRDRLAAMAAASLSLARPDAAERIAGEVLKAAG